MPSSKLGWSEDSGQRGARCSETYSHPNEKWQKINSWSSVIFHLDVRTYLYDDTQPSTRSWNKSEYRAMSMVTSPNKLSRNVWFCSTVSFRCTWTLERMSKNLIKYSGFSCLILHMIKPGTVSCLWDPALSVIYTFHKKEKTDYRTPQSCEWLVYHPIYSPSFTSFEARSPFSLCYPACKSTVQLSFFALIFVVCSPCFSSFMKNLKVLDV